jgi:hypothetical protein
MPVVYTEAGGGDTELRVEALVSSEGVEDDEIMSVLIVLVPGRGEEWSVRSVDRGAMDSVADFVGMADEGIELEI